MLSALALDNDASAPEGGTEFGDPTEIALLVAARRAGYEKPRARGAGAARRGAAVRFRSQAHDHPAPRGAELVAYTKGAPEKILERCTLGLADGRTGPLAAAEIAAMAERMAAEGLRVIGVAYRDWDAVPGELASESLEQGLVLRRPRRHDRPAAAGGGRGGAPVQDRGHPR